MHAQEADVQKLCVGDGASDPNPVCVTKAKLAALLSQSASASLANPTPTSPATSLANPSPIATPPVISINGDNPAIIQVGSTYTDLGATITGSQADLNLGIVTYLNDFPVTQIQLDTSVAATDTIDYVATDQNGLTSTSTRTVIVQPVANDNQAASASTATTTSQ